MEIVILGRLTKTRPELKKIVEKMGGKIVTKMHSNTAVVVSSQNMFDAMGEKMEEAKQLGIQVVLEDFFEAVEQGAMAVEYIAKSCISDWGSDVSFLIRFVLLMCSIYFVRFSRLLESIRTT